MIPTGPILAALLLAQAPAPPPSPSPPGRGVDLGGEATAFLPDGYHPAGGKVDLLVHLHGAATAVEPALAKFPGRAVLVEVNRKGLSKAYSEPFADPALFPRLLDRAVQAVRENEPGHPSLEPGRVAVSSFSAGFGGVRELLKVPEHFARIDTLILADSLYAGYEGNPAEHRVDPALMAGFRAFAVAAATGEKALVLTHSAQVPEGYASTTETADDLLAAVGGRATPGRVDRGGGWVESRRFERGRFILVGFEGVGPEDHLRHLRRIGEVWALTPRSSPAPAASGAASPGRSDTSPGTPGRPG